MDHSTSDQCEEVVKSARDGKVLESLTYVPLILKNCSRELSEWSKKIFSNNRRRIEEDAS